MVPGTPSTLFTVQYLHSAHPVRGDFAWRAASDPSTWHHETVYGCTRPMAVSATMCSDLPDSNGVARKAARKIPGVGAERHRLRAWWQKSTQRARTKALGTGCVLHT